MNSLQRCSTDMGVYTEQQPISYSLTKEKNRKPATHRLLWGNLRSGAAIIVSLFYEFSCCHFNHCWCWSSSQFRKTIYITRRAWMSSTAGYHQHKDDMIYYWIAGLSEKEHVQDKQERPRGSRQESSVVSDIISFAITPKLERKGRLKTILRPIQSTLFL